VQLQVPVTRWLALVAGLVTPLLGQFGAAQTPTSLPKPLPAVPDRTLVSPEKIALGKALFFAPQLSRNDRVACSSCHDPTKGFSNGERFATGVDGKSGTRNVPGLFNVAYQRYLFWDGQARTLEEQALLPIQNPREMGLDLEALERKLNALPDYRQQFQAVFGGPATAARVAQAIAAYERTLTATDTPFDCYLRGDRDALSASALRGLNLFFGDARCVRCHQGPNLTDDDFHNIGTVGDPADPGRRGVTGQAADQGKFRTPTLREVGRTAPYMHNGSFPTLAEVVEHYNFGGVTDRANEHRDERLQVLYLNADQVQDRVRFLREGLTNRPAAPR
jgi:cytochrome c peroxidase